MQQPHLATRASVVPNPVVVDDALSEPRLINDEPGRCSHRILVAIVNYKSATWTAQAVRAVLDIEAEGVHIVVVDNDSGDDALRTIAWAVPHEHLGKVSLIQSSYNGGFAFGTNLAVRSAVSQGLSPDYVLLLNPDTKVLTGAIAELVAFMDAHPRVGICGSRIINDDESVRPSAWRFPSVLRDFERAAKLGLVARAFPRATLRVPIPDEPTAVDWVSGAAMLVRREVIEQVGLLDEGYFLYFEETDWCLRAAMAGWPTWYVPASRVVHYVGKSTKATGAGANERPVPAYWFESRRLFFVKNHGRMYARTADLAWLLGECLWRGRSLLQGGKRIESPHLMRDFLRAAVRPLPLRGRRVGIRSPFGRSANAAEQGQQAAPGSVNQNPKGIGILELLWEDYRTYERNPFEPGFWAVAVHRLGNARLDIPWRPARAPLSLLYRSLNTAVRWGWGIKLDYTVKLGRRVRIWHHGGMVLGAREIGDDVHLRQNTTFGVAHRTRPDCKPIIEAGADIGAGACVVGAVRVGHHSVIGANTVVSRDVPPESVVVGPRGEVIKTRGVRSAQGKQRTRGIHQ